MELCFDWCGSAKKVASMPVAFLPGLWIGSIENPLSHGSPPLGKDGREVLERISAESAILRERFGESV